MIGQIGTRVLVRKRGKVVASSKNLEVLSRYHRKEPVKQSRITQHRDGAGTLHVTFYDGATATAHFASYRILLDWLATKRKRSGWA